MPFSFSNISLLALSPHFEQRSLSGWSLGSGCCSYRTFVAGVFISPLPSRLVISPSLMSQPAPRFPQYQSSFVPALFDFDSTVPISKSAFPYAVAPLPTYASGLPQTSLPSTPPLPRIRHTQWRRSRLRRDTVYSECRLTTVRRQSA